MLIDLIKGIKIEKKTYSHNAFLWQYFKKNIFFFAVSVVILRALLHLKIILTLKRCYIVVLGGYKMCGVYLCTLLKLFKSSKVYTEGTALVFPVSHY